MARIRSVKPEFFKSEEIGRCSVLARLTFVGLWVEADDEGRGRGATEYLWSSIHPFQSKGIRSSFVGALKELQSPDGDGIPLVLFYKHGEATFYWIPRFYRHQHPERPSPSKLPAPPNSEITRRIDTEKAVLEGRGMGVGMGIGEEGGGDPPVPSSTGRADPDSDKIDPSTIDALVERARARKLVSTSPSQMRQYVEAWLARFRDVARVETIIDNNPGRDVFQIDKMLAPSKALEPAAQQRVFKCSKCNDAGCVFDRIEPDAEHPAGIKQSACSCAAGKAWTEKRAKVIR